MIDQETADRMLEVIEGRLFGKYRGSVYSNKDETKRGRLQVIVPSVMGDVPVWALPCVPYAGSNAGFFALPEVGASVWVEFEGGDPSLPIWVGCFWKDGEIPANDASASIKFLRTKNVSIRIDDGDGSIEITTNGGSSLRISGTEITAKAQTVSSEAGTKKTALTPTSFDVHDGAFTVV